MKHALLAVGLLAVLVAGFAGWALESGGVAVVTTRSPDGAERTTHVWFVEEDGVVWLEAGAPENSWYVDVGRSPKLTLVRDGLPPTSYRAVAVPSRSGPVRAALRRKYGLRDRVVGLFVDASRSVAVRLEPLEP